MLDTAFDSAAIAADAVALAERDGWLCGPGVGDNAIAVATTVAVAEGALVEPAGSGPLPVVVVFTVGEEGSADCAALATPVASWRPRRCWPWKATVPTASS
jgi:hypothetical protein